MPDPLVPIGPTAAVVAINGDDATWVVWDASKAFRTPEAAIAALPILGTAILYPGVYTVNITTVLMSMYLIGAEVAWVINANWFWFWGNWSGWLWGWFGWASISATLNINFPIIDNIWTVSWQINSSNLAWLWHFTNIYRRNSPWDLFPEFNGTSTQGRPLIENVWEINCQWSFFRRTVAGSWTSSFTMVKWVSKIICNKLMDGIDDLHINRFIDCWLIVCNSDVISWTVSAFADPKVEFNNCSVKSNSWHLANMDGNGVLIINAFGWTVFDMGATENVVWTWSPVNKVSVMAPRSTSRVSWDWGSNVVNDLSVDTIILASLSVDSY